MKAFGKFVVGLLVVGASIGVGIFIGERIEDDKNNKKATPYGSVESSTSTSSVYVPQLLSRNATRNDFTVEQSIEQTLLKFKDSYKLIPNVDISDLKVTIYYQDNNGSTFLQKTANVGDVTKNSTYYFSFEHSLTEMFKMESYSYNASGGKVSYFA
ncbi:MAG: hypothetical protein MJ222_00370 [Bacilli bacterium]|nr:hypothetical protein [Bacilli bacterium]